MSNHTDPAVKQQIRHRLQTEVLELQFKLNGGELRAVVCTLNSALMPALKIDSHQGPPHDELQVVWDLEKSQWTAFRWERLIMITTK